MLSCTTAGTVAVMRVWMIALLCAALMSVACARPSKQPTVYIAAEEIDWLVLGEAGTPQCTCPDKPVGAPSSIASKFNNQYYYPPSKPLKKAVYIRYTDATFKTKLPIPDSQKHLGILGPLLYVEAGSSLEIVLLNKLPFPVNIQPVGGLTWTQPGSITPVAPQKQATILWEVPVDTVTAAKTEDGYQDSKLFLYHSSVTALAHDNAGLIGPIIVTAKGRACKDGTTKGVDRDIVTLYQVTDESSSPYAHANKLDKGDEIKTYTINGRSWCSLPHLNMTLGERVRWHMASAGIEDNVHNAHWHGNVFLREGHRVDGLSIAGWNTATLDMTPDAEGTWLFHCHVNDHLDGGMVATYTVQRAPRLSAPKPFKVSGEIRTMYIAAEEVEWDYAPYNGEMCSGKKQPFGEISGTYLGPTEGVRVGSKWTKALYMEYTDSTFKTRVQRPPKDAYMGLIGPLVRAIVGDQIKIVFHNRLKHAVSLHPHGVQYDKYSEGAGYKDGSPAHSRGDDYVLPNTTYTYTWNVPERAGPGPADTSSLVWLMHSHADESADTNAGLFGAIIINKKGVAGDVPVQCNSSQRLPASYSVSLPKDVDEEVVLIFSVMDERNSIYAVDNVKKRLDKSLTRDLAKLFEREDFTEASKHHMINGWMYCNNPPLAFTAGRKVRFHVMVYGAQTDMHVPSIGGGGSYQVLGLHHSSFATVAGAMTTLDVVFTSPGKYHLECRVNDHSLAGMSMSYQVLPAPDTKQPSAFNHLPSRTYYIAAEQVMWDYAPRGFQQCGLAPLKEDAALYLQPTACTLGSKRSKALFRQYTDGSYKKLTPRDAYLGMLGPVISAEVGTVINVVLKNRLTFPVSFAPDGGLVALHGTHGTVVQPGQQYTYTYFVPKQAGPLKGDVDSVAHAYFSDVDTPAHTSAGLVGIVNIAAEGSLKSDYVTPKGVDKHIFLMFAVTDESLSPLHVEKKPPKTKDASDHSDSCNEEVIAESNHMHHINGYSFCNLPDLTVAYGSKVRVSAISFGSEEGIHSPYFAGQTMIPGPGSLAFGQLMPTVTATNDMLITARPGVWLVGDGVSNHEAEGEIGQVRVVAPPSRRAI